MREQSIHKQEVHVAGLCFKDDNVLLAKRASHKKLYPNYWEGCGGQVLQNENFEEAILRKFKEELGVLTTNPTVFKTYEILTPKTKQKKIPGIRFICFFHSYVNQKYPQITSDHTEYRWIDKHEISQLNLIPGLKEDIEEAFQKIKEKNKKQTTNSQ